MDLPGRQLRHGLLTSVFVLAVLALHGWANADEGVSGRLWAGVAPLSTVTAVVPQAADHLLGLSPGSGDGVALTSSATDRVVVGPGRTDVAPTLTTACLAMLAGGLLTLRRTGRRLGLARRRDAGRVAGLQPWSGIWAGAPPGTSSAAIRRALIGVMLT